jgi:hypothetical protein
MIFNSKTLKILVLSHIFSICGPLFLIASFRNGHRSMSDGNLGAYLREQSSSSRRTGSRAGNRFIIDTPRSDDESSYLVTPSSRVIFPDPIVPIDVDDNEILPEVENIYSLIDNLSYSLLLAEIKNIDENRNRLPHLTSFYFHYSENIKIGNFVDLTIPNDLKIFFYGFAEAFKGKRCSDIFNFLNENIFSRDSEEDSFCAISNCFKTEFKLKIDFNSRRSKKQKIWVKSFIKKNFLLKNDLNKRLLASFIFTFFLVKTVEHYYSNKNVDVPLDLFPFYAEFGSENTDFKRDIYSSTVEVGYRGAIFLFSNDVEKHEGLLFLLENIFFFLNTYESHFMDKDFPLDFYAKNAEFLMRLLKVRINDLEDRSKNYLVREIYRFLNSKNIGDDGSIVFLPQEYHYLLNIIKNVLKKKNHKIDFDKKLLKNFVLVQDKHIKKVILENKIGSPVAIPQGGHLDIEVGYNIIKAPEDVSGRASRLEVVGSVVLTENDLSRVVCVDWIISKNSVRDSSFEDEILFSKTSTIFPASYTDKFNDYLRFIYNSLKFGHEKIVSIFAAESNEFLEKKAFIIKYPANLFDDELSGDVYVLLIMSKKFGFDSISTIYPLGCYVFDYEKLDSISGITYSIAISKDPVDGYDDKMIDGTEISQIIDEKIFKNPMLRIFDGLDYLPIDKIAFKDIKGNRFRFVKALNGIYVKKRLD